MLSIFRRHYILIIILPLFVIRFLIIQNSSLTFFSDDAIYASFARNWYEGDWKYVFHPFWPPLYPFLSSLVFNLVNSWEITLRLTSLLSSILIIIPTYYLVKYLTSKLTATLASVSIFLLTPIVHFSIFPFSDMLSASLVTSALTTMYFALIKENTKLFVITAILHGLIYLTRSEGTMFFALSGFYLGIYLVSRVIFKKIPLKKIKILPIFLIVFLLVASPYLITVKNQLGYWSLSQKFSAQIQQEQAFEYKSNTTWAQEVWSIKYPNYNSHYFRNGSLYVLDNLYTLLDNFYEKVKKWGKLLFISFPVWFMVGSLIGLLRLQRKDFWGNLFIVYILFTAIPITIFSTTVIDVRYLLWVIPLIVIFFYKAIFNILQKFPIFPIFMKSFVPFTLILLTPAFSFQSLDVESYSNNFTNIHYRPQLKEVAEFIKQHSKGEGPKIMTRHEGIEFYSRGITIYIPQDSYIRVLEFTQKYNTDYIVAWHRELSQEKELAGLANPNTKHEKLNIELSLETPEGNIVVYTLKKEK